MDYNNFKWLNEGEIKIEGDFVLQVKVSHDFKDTYDSKSIMVMQDMKNWAKFGLAEDMPGRERILIPLFNGWGEVLYDSLLYVPEYK